MEEECFEVDFDERSDFIWRIEWHRGKGTRCVRYFSDRSDMGSYLDSMSDLGWCVKSRERYSRTQEM